MRIDHKQCEQAYRYLTDPTCPPNFKHAYLSDPIKERSDETLLHCVTLQGDPNTRRLWSYIEYFGMFRVVVLLSTEYVGPKKYESHAINPIDGSIAKRLRIEFSEPDLVEILNGNGWTQKGYIAASDYAMPKILARNRERSFERVLEEGYHYAARTLGIARDTPITKELAGSFTKLMMEKVEPYIDNLFRATRNDAAHQTLSGGAYDGKRPSDDAHKITSH
jgi:hypothetical protein